MTTGKSIAPIEGHLAELESGAHAMRPMAILGALLILLTACGGNVLISPPQIKKLTPVVTWTTPAEMTYGATLGPDQLNATASLPGTFTYAPALGTVLSAGVHSLSVTFTPADAADYATATASVALTVTPAIPTLAWAAPPAISYGAALGINQLNATASVPGTFTYAPALGTVLSAGVHSLSVTFTPADAADYATATAAVVLTVNSATPVLSWQAPASITYGTALDATELDATANVAGTFAYTPALGAQLGAGRQTLSVTFTPSDTADYASATATVQLTVNKAAPELTWAPPASIPYGTALAAAQLNATANVPGAFAYLPAQGAVLNSGAQTLSATFTPTDTGDYTTATVSVMLTVEKATPVLNWATPAAILYGAVLGAAQLNATANLPGAFVYNPAPGTLLDAGSQTLSATFTATDTTDYAPATASVTLMVNPATPVLSWATEAPIAVGYPLSAAQLDAVASTPGGKAIEGTYLYTPEASTSFSSPGPETLQVVFLPADALDYTQAQATTTLTVTATGVVAWGDSLTQGEQGNIDQGNYPADLQAAINLPVENMGVGGQTTCQIGVRQGGVPTYATVSGGVIPAAGGVTVTFPTSPVSLLPVTTWQTPNSISGSILGVHGTVTLVSGVYTFTRTAPGDPVSAPGAPQFVVDTPFAAYIPIFWEGRNNFTGGATVLNNIKAQVATVSAGLDYLVMSILNINNAAEWQGGATYNVIAGQNSAISAAFGSHYLDIRHVLVESYDPSLVTDVSDYAHDEVPTSLRAIIGTGTLNTAIGPADTTFTVTTNSNVGFNAGFILTIDTGANAENVQITSASAGTVTVIRGFGGNNTSHAAGAAVTETDNGHLNASGYQVVANAVAAYLAPYANPAQKPRACAPCGDNRKGPAAAH
jgi:hypothetical protein